MAKNDWNTSAPDMGEIKSVCDTLADNGFDMHTVEVLLDNGGWRVTVKTTDEDMQDQDFVYELSRSGALERIA